MAPRKGKQQGGPKTVAETPPTRPAGSRRQAARRPAPLSLEAGQCLAERYTVLGQLGQGGMGVVVSAYDAKLDRRVALKLLKARADSQGESEQRRLMREAQTMARLSHPHVVTVYDVGQLEDGRVFLAMEMVEGTTLRHWCQVEGRTWHQVLEAYLAAGRGLAAAHAVGLVHRDFKPDNVLVGKDGRVRVTDFGLARADETQLGDGSAAECAPGSPLWEMSLTEPGLVPGTPKYMAPELLQGKPASARTDVYAFCLALYEALYRQSPFAGQHGSGRAEGPRPRQVTPPPSGAGVPSWVGRPVLQGLSYQASERPASMDVLLEALSRSPTRLWLRALAVAAGGALVLGGAATLHLRATAQAQLCAEGPRLAGLWDEPARERMRQAFAATGQTYAVDASRGVQRSLDAYAEGWGKMYRETCEATRVHGVQPEPVLTLRMACLERHRQRLDAVVEVLTQANDGLVRQASEALTTLAPIEECADVAALQAEVPAPQDAARRQEVEALRRELARVRTLASDEGQGLRAAQALDAAIARARTLQYPPVLAEALLLKCRESSFEPRVAISACNEAVWTAQSQRQERIAVEASTEMITRQLGIGTPEMLDFWRDYAISALARARGEALLEARLQHSLAHLWMSRGQTAQAQEAIARARVLTQATLERSQGDSLLELRLLDDLGSYLHDEYRFAEALEYYQRHIALLTQLLGPQHPQVFLTSVRRSGLMGLAGQMPQSVAFLEDTIVRAEQALGAHHPTLSSLRTSLVRRQMAAGLLEEAGRNQDRLWALLEATTPAASQPRLSWAVISSVLALQRGAYAQGLQHAQLALEQIHRLGLQQTSREAWATNTVALAQLKLGRLPEARTLLERAAQMVERVEGAQSLELQTFRYDLAHYWEARGDHAQALQVRQSVLERLQQLEGGHGSWLQREPMRVDVARSLLRLGRAAEALEQARQAVAVLRTGLGEQAPELLRAWQVQGEALLVLGRAAEALAPLESAVQGAERAGLDPNEQAWGRFLLARARLEAGQPPALAAEQVTRAQEDYARTAWPHAAQRAELLRWARTRLASLTGPRSEPAR